MRTIILTQVPSNGGSSYWTVSESGRHIDGLGNDEALWAIACLLVNTPPKYNGGMQTIDEYKNRQYALGVKHARAGAVPENRDPDVFDDETPF